MQAHIPPFGSYFRTDIGAVQSKAVSRSLQRSPGSRLSDDLYRMYLLGLGWFVFPIYGAGFAEVLPTSSDSMRWAYTVATIIVAVGWLWSGARGGPMMVSRASIVHELGAPVSARAVLGPQLLRQAVGWASGGALAGGVLTSIGNEYSFAAAFAMSSAGFLLSFAAVAWASVVMVAVRRPNGVDGRYLASAVGAAVAVVGTVLMTRSVTSGLTMGVISIAAVVGGATAWHALGSVPVPSLWNRARNLESVRSAFIEVDFHRMMTDLRGAGDNRPAGRTRLPPRFTSLWRCVAPIRHAMPWSGLRLGMSLVAAVLLVVFAPLEQGIVLLSLAAVWLFVGYELTRGVAALADQVSFVLHYRRGSFPLLVGQVVVSFALGGLLIALVSGWRFGEDRSTATAAVLVAAMGIVGGAMQARLGSPDTMKLVSTYGLQSAAGLLWARAAAAPITLLLLVIVVFHGYGLQPLDYYRASDVAELARTAIPVLFASAVLICVRPLRRMAR